MSHDSKILEILSLSMREALAMGDDYIGPEHVLLAICRDGDNAAVQALATFREIDTETLRQRINEHRTLNKFAEIGSKSQEES